MSDRQPSQPIRPTLQESADLPAQNGKVTHEMVIAISDRIYEMLLRELKVERERQRVLNRSHH